MPGPVFLRGDRIDLRTIERDDAPFLQRHVNHPDVRRYIGVFDRPQSERAYEETFEETISGDDGVHLLACAGEERVGSVSLFPLDERRRCANLGVWITPDEQGNGYATDATAMLVDYAFAELGLHRVSGVALAPNAASRRLLERVGFTHDGTLRDADFVDGEFVDQEYYSLLEDEWRARGGLDATPS